MSVARSAPLPVKDRIARPDGKITQHWLEALDAQRASIDESPSLLIDPVELTAQGAALATTPMPTASLPAGLYRVTFYARITRAATTSSSLTVSFHFTESGLSLTLSAAALTGNTTSTVQSDSFLVQIDEGSPLSYSAAYVSVGGTSMQFRLSIIAERIATS